MAVLMVMTMLPVTAIAEEIEELGCTHHLVHTEECGFAEEIPETPCGHVCSDECGEVCAHEHDAECGYAAAVPGSECNFHCEKCEADVIYSDEVFYFTAESSVMAEDSGMNEFVLSRAEGSEKTSVTVLVYDYSANYEKDYVFYINGEAVRKIEGSRSIYDVFAESGENTDAKTLDVAATVGQIYEEEIVEDMRASEMFAELDSFGVRAAEISLVFEENETEKVITVEVIDDDESEYEENFMLAVLDEKGEVVETAQALLGISDNEEKPEVKISFNCEKELELNENGVAILTFKREGNLATNSLAVLFHDGEPLGYVDFAPYQTEQTVEAAYTGVYMLGDENGNITDMTEVFVSDPMAGIYIVPEGADPELDAVPDSYATIPDIVEGTPSWFPDWAKYTEFVETETQKIYMGSNNMANSYYEQYSNSSQGSTSWFPNGDNNIGVNTSGDGSHVSSGTNKIRTKWMYDLTGIASIEVATHLTGVDKNAKIGLEVDNCEGWHKTVTSGGTYNMTATVPLGSHEMEYVYVYNCDPQFTGGGTNLWVANGFLANKRQYNFEIRDDLSPKLSYYGGIETHPIVDGNNDLIKVYPADNNESYNKVNIIFNADSSYPAKLVGYKLYNSNSQKTSNVINLNGSNGFYFTIDFLSRYEGTYMWSGDVNGDTAADPVFSVIPVYEKIPVYYSIKAAKGGTVELMNPKSELYMGDYAVFKNSSGSELNLTGVYYEAYTDLSSDVAHSATVYADEDGLIRIKLNGVYTKYIFKGVYSADADELSVYYADEEPNGEITGGEGVKVSSENYVKNEYVTLIAKANENYVTKWTVDTETYYGDVLYHQLNGDPDCNKIMVSFVPEASVGVKTANINGKVNSSNVNLFLMENTPSALSDAEISITAGSTYKATTDKNGNYSISSFKGVPGGKYTVLISYAGGFAYSTITFDDSNSYIISVPQFTVGDCYPIGVSAALSGGDPSVNMIELESGRYVEIRVTVQGKENSVPKKVKLYFYDTVAGAGSSLNKSIEAATETIGNVSYWDIKIPTEEISSNTRLYIEVESEKTIVQRDTNGNIIGTETYTATSALADGGYEFSVDYEDSTIPVQYDIPSTPSVTELEDVFAEALRIPILGGADFRITSNTGGFFVTRTDPDTGCVYMMCGYSFEGLYATGSISDKYEGAKKTSAAATNIGSRRQSGSNDAVTQPVDVNNNDGGGGDTQAKKPSNWTFAPAFMFKMTAKPGVTDTENYYVSAYETIIGFDLWYFKNFPFNVYGVPLYVSVSFGVEAVFELAAYMKEDSVQLGSSDIKEIFNNLIDYDEGGGDIQSIEGVFGASKLDIGVKGGVGFNSFLGLFIAGTVRIPILFQVSPKFEVGGKIGFSIAAGADIVLFTGSLNVSVLDFYYGDNEDDDDNGDGVVDEKDYDIIGELKTIQGEANARSSYGSTSTVESINDFNFEEELNKMTFSLMSRSGGTTLRNVGDPSVIASDTFKNTGIQLWELGNGKLLAAFLKDNGEEGLNYLSAVYAISDDGGKTWSEEKFFNDNTSAEGSSLQYDINIFELEDRTLVTWSEADFDKLITEMGLDPNNLTAAHVAKLMGAMNLRGVFIDKNDGSVIGEAFTIAENSTVACGVLDAVQNGENVYVYYQRNAIPETEDFTVSDLMSLERTIALARANIEEENIEWISSSVRVENEAGQQYRIAGVEPFSYKGIVGEVIVIDRDGKLAVPQADGSWENSVEDRMMVLRVYEFDPETGAPITSVIVPLTDAGTNSQNPQVVSDDENIYLFFNQDGNIVYLKNFVADENAGEDIKAYSAFAVKNSDGSYSANNPPEADPKHIASHNSINYGTKFTVSMDGNENILLCWIADEQKEGVLLATEEIYGVMLRYVTNAQAFELMGLSLEEEDDANARQLWAVGEPVDITDENGLFGAVDSLCVDGTSGEFLLGYTKLNDTVRTQATASEIKVVTGTNEPDVVIESVIFDQYPMPGSTVSVQVSVANNGFKPLNGVNITAKGVTIEGSLSDANTIWPGTSEKYLLNLEVPENFSATEEIELTVSGIGSQSGYGDSNYFEIAFDDFFTVEDVWQTSIPGTNDVRVKVTVVNKGNTYGVPEITVTNTIFGEEDEPISYKFSGENEVAPGESAVIEYILENTYINEEQTAQINVRTGDEDGQYIQEFMPKPAKVIDTGKDEDGDGIPGYSHEHKWSEWKTVNGVKSRECSTCGIVEKVYIADGGKTEDEANPETGAAVVIFEKSAVNYIENAKVFEKKRRK